MHGSEQSRMMEDWLGRVRITLPTTPIRAERCIATVVSPGFEGMLEGMLTNLNYAEKCSDAVCVVFAVDADAACRQAIARHGAITVECTSPSPLNSRIRAVLYTIAHVADAEQYACVDSDIFVLGDLQPMFAALDACRDGSILTCRDPYIHSFAPNLGDSLTTFYASTSEDVEILLGQADGYVKSYPLLVNEGIVAGNRKAIVALDQFLRSLPSAAKAWVDILPNMAAATNFCSTLRWLACDAASKWT